MIDTTTRPPPSARASVVGAIGFGAAYLTWRVGFTRDGSTAWMFWMLWAAELTVLASLLRMAFETWTLRGDRAQAPTAMSVDVVVIARDEPLEVLRATLLGCVALRGEHRDVVVDTAGRPALQRLASDLGIDVIRHDPAPTSAAPEELLDEVLAELDGELIATLRGDDVPLPELLEELVGDFADPSVWMAQGRQNVYGPSAGEFGGSSDELGTFFELVLPGKNRHAAAYWCGSGAVLRREAIDALGGVPRQTDTPTFQLSLAAHEAGWRSTYHPRATVLTLARPDVEGFVARNALWATGNIASLRTRRSPLFAPGLTARQRLCYLGTISGYLAGPRRLAVVAVLATMLLTGWLPLSADPWLLVPLWGTWMGLFVLARRALARGHASTAALEHEQWLLMGAHVSAWLALLVPRSVVDALRAPVPTVGHRHLPPRLRVRLLLASACLLLFAATLRLATLTSPLGLPEMSRSATTLSLASAATLVVVIVSVIARARTRTRRGSPRFSVEGSARVGGVVAPLIEVSETGATVRMAQAARVGCPYVVGLMIPGLDGTIHQATVAGEVRSVRPSPSQEGGHLVGLSFTHLSTTAKARLAEYCRVLLPARAAAVASFDEPLPVGRPRRDELDPPDRSAEESTRAV